MSSKPTIVPAPEDDDERRRYYRITPFGKAVAKAEVRRLNRPRPNGEGRRVHAGARLTCASTTCSCACIPRRSETNTAREMRMVFAERHRHASGAGKGRIASRRRGRGAVQRLAGAPRHPEARSGYTARVLRRAPGFAITAIVIVALGIGATTAAFSVTDFVLIRPLPFPEPERLAAIWSATPGYPRMELSPPNYRDLAAAATSFESMGVHTGRAVTMTIDGEAQRVQGEGVSADLFAALGVAPAIGRTFRLEDDTAGAPGTILLSHRFWQRQFGGDPRVLGRAVALDNVPHTIIGVMPDSLDRAA